MSTGPTMRLDRRCQTCDEPPQPYATFCIACGGAIVEQPRMPPVTTRTIVYEGDTQRIVVEVVERPILGMYKGRPVYEYSEAMWNDPAFTLAHDPWLVPGP